MQRGANCNRAKSGHFSITCIASSIFAAADYSGDRGNLKYTVLSGTCVAGDLDFEPRLTAILFGLNGRFAREDSPSRPVAF
jgi:hypothetical protein